VNREEYIEMVGSLKRLPMHPAVQEFLHDALTTWVVVMEALNMMAQRAHAAGATADRVTALIAGPTKTISGANVTCARELMNQTSVPDDLRALYANTIMAALLGLSQQEIESMMEQLSDAQRLEATSQLMSDFKLSLIEAPSTRIVVPH
jgi:uncharacterized membrane protein